MRIANIANYYLKKGDEEFGAIETSTAHFEDVEGLQRGALLRDIGELAGGLVRETLEIGELVSKEQFDDYFSFANRIAGFAGSEKGSLTAVTQHSSSCRRRIPTLQKGAPRPLREFHAKVGTLKGLIDALETLSTEGPRTMAEQARKPQSAALGKAYATMQGHIAYVDRKAAIRTLVQEKQARTQQRAQRRARRTKQEQLEQQQAFQRQQDLQKRREAFRAQLAKTPKPASRPVSRTTYSPAPQPTYTPISSYKPDEGPRTIRDCVRQGLDPHEVLGTREVNRQLDAIERKHGREDTQLDYNARRY